MRYYKLIFLFSLILLISSNTSFSSSNYNKDLPIEITAYKLEVLQNEKISVLIDKKLSPLMKAFLYLNLKQLFLPIPSFILTLQVLPQ